MSVFKHISFQQHNVFEFIFFTGIITNGNLKDFKCQTDVPDLLKRVRGLQKKIARDYMKAVFIGKYDYCLILQITVNSVIERVHNAQHQNT